MIRLQPALLIVLVWLSCSPAPAQDNPPAADRFAVGEYRVQGNTRLPAPGIERAVYPFLGPGKTAGDVDQAREGLEKAYRDAGYATVYVDVPEQDISAGIVRLNVTEGSVGRVRVTGSRYYSNGWMREQLPALTAGSVPRLPELQSQLNALNARSPDRLVTPVLKPGQTPGTVDMELKIQDQLPLHGNLEFSNRNTSDTTATRAGFALRYDNLWQRDHSFGLQYQVAPENRDETQVWVATYLLRPERSPVTYAFYAVDSKSSVATLGGDLSVIGQGTIVGARAIVQLPPTAKVFHSLVLGVDFKDFDELLGFTAEGDQDIVTPIDYLNWSVGYNATKTSAARTQSFAAGLGFGIRGLANESNELVPDPSSPGRFLVTGEFADKRYLAQPNYWYLTGGYDLVQPLGFLDTVLFWSSAAQWSPRPLISNEQFAAGGLDSVRGYYEAEQLGDYGVRTSLEWRTANLGPGLWRKLTDLHAYLFSDLAHLRLNDPLPDQNDVFSLASAGLGVRFAGEGFSANLAWALPLRDTSATASGDDRWLFLLKYGF